MDRQVQNPQNRLLGRIGWKHRCCHPQVGFLLLHSVLKIFQLIESSHPDYQRQSPLQKVNQLQILIIPIKHLYTDTQIGVCQNTGDSSLAKLTHKSGHPVDFGRESMNCAFWKDVHWEGQRHTLKGKIIKITPQIPSPWLFT